jgi:hypothetical protein
MVGWTFTQGLGSKNSILAKMVASVDAESAFDENSNQAIVIL